MASLTERASDLAEGLRVVRTVAGDLRGKFENGVFAFKGVRYGEDTSARRFQQAEPVRRWQGIWDAFDFGPQCFQPVSPDFELLRSGWDQRAPPARIVFA